jgi:maleate isomerase
MTRPVGILVPSSNTVMEAGLARLAVERGGGPRLLHTRVRVVTIDETVDRQFAVAPMVEGARLLADAEPAGIVWGGTSGGWLGLSADGAIVDGIRAATGLPATTTTIATVGRLRDLGARSIGFVTPYVVPVCARIEATYRNAGFERVLVKGYGMSHNADFAGIGDERLAETADALVAAGCDALVTYCTNVDGLALVGAFAERGIPVLDSVAVTYDAAVALSGRIEERV